jgi:hypothetical protein
VKETEISLPETVQRLEAIYDRLVSKPGAGRALTKDKAAAKKFASLTLAIEAGLRNWFITQAGPFLYRATSPRVALDFASASGRVPCAFKA